MTDTFPRQYARTQRFTLGEPRNIGTGLEGIGALDEDAVAIAKVEALEPAVEARGFVRGKRSIGSAGFEHEVMARDDRDVDRGNAAGKVGLCGDMAATGKGRRRSEDQKSMTHDLVLPGPVRA